MAQAEGVKKLYKSRTDRMIDGVCGGIGRYFNVDPTLVRISWVLLTLLGGSGIILYIVAMIVMPKEPFVFTGTTTENAGQPWTDNPSSLPTRKNSLFWGVLLIVVGTFLFLNNLGLAPWHFWWAERDLVLSLLLILAGAAFLWGGRNSLTGSESEETGGTSATESKDEGAAPGAESYRTRRLYRSYTDKKLLGVCGGLAAYAKMDSTIVRLLFVVATIASGGLALIVYLLCGILIPKETPTYTVH